MRLNARSFAALRMTFRQGFLPHCRTPAIDQGTRELRDGKTKQGRGEQTPVIIERPAHHGKQDHEKADRGADPSPCRRVPASQSELAIPLKAMDIACEAAIVLSFKVTITCVPVLEPV